MNFIYIHVCVCVCVCIRLAKKLAGIFPYHCTENLNELFGQPDTHAHAHTHINKERDK